MKRFGVIVPLLFFPSLLLLSFGGGSWWGAKELGTAVAADEILLHL